MACLPLLIFEFGGLLETSSIIDVIHNDLYWYINLLSLLRFLMVSKIFSTVLLLAARAGDVYFTKRTLIENSKNIAFKVT